MSRLVLAIDGPAASGKGTLARKLAAHYGLPHLDTGLLYRATARALLDAGHSLGDVERAAAAAASLDVALLDESRLRGAQMGEAASVVAALPAVRAALIALQRGFAAVGVGAVLDGRDIGTVICPEADVKLFVTASPAIRAARRHKELSQASGPSSDPSSGGRSGGSSGQSSSGACTPAFDAVLADIRRRDARDSGRADAPLKPAADAVTLDTSALSVEETLAAAIAAIEARRPFPPR